MTPDERIAEKAATAKRRLHSTLIAVTDRLDQPYPDRPELSPWTAFVRPMIDVVDSALDDLVAQLRDAQAEAERLREHGIMVPFPEWEKACAERDSIAARLAEVEQERDSLAERLQASERERAKTFDCRARIEPEPDGRWKISLIRLYRLDSPKVFMWPREIEKKYGVTATAYRRTEARARRSASRMLARLRRAIVNNNREWFEVDR